MLKGLVKKALKFSAKKYIKATQKFTVQTKSVHNTQEQVLLEKLRKNSSTEYGKRYGFSSINSSSEFQQRVPIVSYDDISSNIERIKKGAENVLTLENPLIFVTTSGTTSTPKFIPITPDFLNEYLNSWNIWICNAVKDHLGIVYGKVVSVVSPPIEGYTSAGIPFGAMTGLTLGNQSRLSRFFYALPKEIFSIQDSEARHYLTLRIGIEKNASMFNTANPSTIKKLALMGDKLKEKIIKDIYDGEISIAVSHKDIDLVKRITPKKNPKRARQLEKIVEQTGNLYPKDYWPNLAMIGCWKGGTLSLYLDSFPMFFSEQTSVRDLGLIASEGRISIPLSDSNSDGVLDIGSHFFEFIPESEADSKNPITLKTYELEKGKYFVLMTTSSGLYRYNLNDLVEVTGFYNQAPTIKFLNKGNNISSLTGEKLTEHQVVGAMQQASKIHSLSIDSFLVTPMFQDLETPRYVLLLEKSQETQDREKLKRVSADFDSALKGLNIEYACKREGRLETVSIGLVPEGTFEEMRKEFLESSQKDTQYKHKFLNPKPDSYKDLKAELIL